MGLNSLLNAVFTVFQNYIDKNRLLDMAEANALDEIVTGKKANNQWPDIINGIEFVSAVPSKENNSLNERVIVAGQENGSKTRIPYSGDFLFFIQGRRNPQSMIFTLSEIESLKYLQGNKAFTEILDNALNEISGKEKAIVDILSVYTLSVHKDRLTR